MVDKVQTTNLNVNLKEKHLNNSHNAQQESSIFKDTISQTTQNKKIKKKLKQDIFICQFENCGKIFRKKQRFNIHKRLHVNVLFSRKFFINTFLSY